MHDWHGVFETAIGAGDEPPRDWGAIDGRSTAGRRLSAARRALEREFAGADPLRLKEATILHIGLARLEPSVARGDTNAITQASKLSNTLMRLRRELAISAARNRESARC